MPKPTSLREYVDALNEENRALFDRMHRLVLEAHPDAEVLISYDMPTYVVGERRLYVAAWSHGLSVYGWDHGRDGGFAARHPELDSGKGTLKIPRRLAGQLPDDELRELARAALAA